ncbi:hypothetical protein CRENBAI_001792 [Crenichthys baileyi]|uniref:Uncharacterized protein n=1 Tax=Crenichthys baileyi TaxID=28760 RepID=A0AAV9SMK8_9TELE
MVIFMELEGYLCSFTTTTRQLLLTGCGGEHNYKGLFFDIYKLISIQELHTKLWRNIMSKHVIGSNRRSSLFHPNLETNQNPYYWNQKHAEKHNINRRTFIIMQLDDPEPPHPAEENTESSTEPVSDQPDSSASWFWDSRSNISVGPNEIQHDCCSSDNLTRRFHLSS